MFRQNQNNLWNILVSMHLHFLLEKSFAQTKHKSNVKLFFKPESDFTLTWKAPHHSRFMFLIDILLTLSQSPKMKYSQT